MPRTPNPGLFDADPDPVVRRYKVLKHTNFKPSERAMLAGVLPNDLRDYIMGLREEGLLDTGERPSAHGAVFVLIGDEPGIDKRRIWRRLGGSEGEIDTALMTLVENDLIVPHGEGYRLNAPLSAEG